MRHAFASARCAGTHLSWPLAQRHLLLRDTESSDDPTRRLACQEMLLIGHIALAAWTPRHAALAVHPASRSRPAIAAAEVSVAAAAAEVRRDDESAGASLPPSLPLTAHDLRTGPCSYSLATLALTHPPPLPARRAAVSVPKDAPAHPTRSPRAGPKPKAGAETGDNEAEKYGKDPRPSLASGEPAAGWVVPATGSLGQIANVPELDAALAAAEGRSKVVVVKFFAPWCTSCKVRRVKKVLT